MKIKMIKSQNTNHKPVAERSRSHKTQRAQRKSDNADSRQHLLVQNSVAKVLSIKLVRF
jgi:hypothetical protein